MSDPVSSVVSLFRTTKAELNKDMAIVISEAFRRQRGALPRCGEERSAVQFSSAAHLLTGGGAVLLTQPDPDLCPTSARGDL
ncbi:hypothetical protein GN956_G7990 [Arapaima gigas]